MNRERLSYLWLIVGGTLLAFMGWRWNVPIAMWLAPIFLIRFFRSQRRWPLTLLAIPLMTAALTLNVHGGWDFSILAEIGIGFARALPFLIALYADRHFSRTLKPGWASLVYPAAYVVADYLMAFTPLGSVFSVAVTQFDSAIFAQLAAITGIWGIGFVIGWFASVVNLIWEHDFNLKQAGVLAIALPAVIIAILLLGGMRLSMAEPAAETVRVAGVSVTHQRDYYGVVIDQGSAQATVHQFDAEYAAVNAQLFAESARAADYGSQIIFWSEGNGIVTPEGQDALIAEAQAFAREHEVYFSPAYIVFRYGEMTADNKLVMITPEGDIAYQYTKTKSWYETDSDGILHTVDTPYGILSSAICFDMDFPAFINQAARQNVDIMLVPSYDWEPIKPYHTKVGLFRAIENGFSIFRQVNEGTSMAVDYQGKVLAYQDYFDTADPIMIADLPVQGVTTLYGLLGDWFAYLNVAFLVGLLGLSLTPRFASQRAAAFDQVAPAH